MTMSLLLEHFDDLLVTAENAVQLNHAVLQLAIQGKLVEQDSKDESVNSVINRLQNWNDERFSNSATELEKPFDIPESWEWRTIGDVCQTTSGGTPSRQNPNYYGGNIPWLKSGELEDTLIEQIEEAITEEGLANSSAKIFPAGTPLIALYGATVGKTGLLGLDAATNQAVCALFPTKEIIDTQYLLKYLQSQRQKLLDISAGGAQPNISQKVIREWLIPIPPLAEQQRIVARVEELFVQTHALAKELDHSQIELDGLNQSALAHLLASETPEEFNQHWDFIAEHFDLLFQTPEHVAPLRQSILELAVRGKLTRREAGDESVKELLKQIKKEVPLPPIKENEKPFELPEGWEWARWGDISPRVTVGYVGSMANEYVVSGIPFLRSQNVRANRYEPKGLTYISPKFHEKIAKSTLKSGDLVVVRSGSVGVTCVIPETLTEANCSDLVIIQKSPVVLSDYGSFYMNTLARRVVEAGTVGMALTHFNTKSVAMIPISIPPLAEQERIVKRVEQLLSLCDALEARLQSAEEERGRLVTAVMSTVGG